MKPILIQLPLADVAILDKLVALNFYPNRNEAIRFAVHDLVRRERKLLKHARIKSDTVKVAKEMECAETV